MTKYRKIPVVCRTISDIILFEKNQYLSRREIINIILRESRSKDDKDHVRKQFRKLMDSFKKTFHPYLLENYKWIKSRDGFRNTCEYYVDPTQLKYGQYLDPSTINTLDYEKYDDLDLYLRDYHAPVRVDDISRAGMFCNTCEYRVINEDLEKITCPNCKTSDFT